VKVHFFLLVAAFAGLSEASLASGDIGTIDPQDSSLLKVSQSQNISSASSLGSAGVVRQAREDAASFIGSDGAMRGVHLEAALIHIRTLHTELKATDMQLARAILAL
jgi:uncharacterized protein (TIGR02448 family)